MILVLVPIDLLTPRQAVDVGAHALFLFVVFTPGVCYYLVLVVHLVQRNGSFHNWQQAPTWISTLRKFDRT
jgi:hypothetical protein